MADSGSSEVESNSDAVAGDVVTPGPDRIGPGCAILIVGPSGAGKDTLITLVRQQLRGDDRVVFPERIVTRAAHAAENHASLTMARFEAEVARGAYALHWFAHGLGYGVPARIDVDIRDGRTVILNCARAAVAEARNRYAKTLVILIDAPRDVRAQRLAARGREAAPEIEARLTRSADGFEAAHADVMIFNDGPPEVGAGRLYAMISAIAERKEQV